MGEKKRRTKAAPDDGAGLISFGGLGKLTAIPGTSMAGAEPRRLDDGPQVTATAGVAVLEALSAAFSSGVPHSFSYAEGTGDRVLADDRAWFAAHADRCTRIRAALPTECGGRRIPEPGAEFRTAVINVSPELGMRTRLLFCVRPGAPAIPPDDSDPEDTTALILRLGGLPAMGESGIRASETAIALSRRRLGR